MSEGRATNRPILSSVTLVAVTSVAVAATVDALHRSMRQAQFAEVLLLTDGYRLPHASPTIQWRQIDRLGSRAQFSWFMLRELASYVSTSHALCIQWDGYVLDGDAWDPGFLDYDYIGALWPQFDDDHNVGNGGFSLRSKRLLEVCRDLPFDGLQAEDLVICRVRRDSLEERGISFAPAAVARRFAYERTAFTGREFGFHGAFNLVKHVSAADALRTFHTLEPMMLARNERWEILRWALKRGRMRLALEMMSRL